MKVNVTRQDIDQGERANCCNCPVARAIARLVPEGDQVEVLYASILRRGLQCRIVRIPEEVRDFIKKFDRGRWVKPFSFDLPDSFFA